MISEDFSTICPGCGAAMAPEHAHYRCRMCGYRDTCCDGAPAPACDPPFRPSPSPQDTSTLQASAGRQV